jgi:hypothetical protein
MMGIWRAPIVVLLLSMTRCVRTEILERSIPQGNFIRCKSTMLCLQGKDATDHTDYFVSSGNGRS